MTVHAARMGDWNRYLIRILFMNDRYWLADSYITPQHCKMCDKYCRGKAEKEGAVFFGTLVS